ERHPLNIERRAVESSFPGEVVLRNRAKELRVEWSQRKMLLGSLEVKLQSLASRFNQERKKAETNQAQEVSLARSRFIEAIEKMHRKEATLEAQEKDAIGKVTQRYESETAQLSRALANLRSRRAEEKTKAWMKAHSIRAGLTS